MQSTNIPHHLRYFPNQSQIVLGLNLLPQLALHRQRHVQNDLNDRVQLVVFKQYRQDLSHQKLVKLYLRRPEQTLYLVQLLSCHQNFCRAIPSPLLQDILLPHAVIELLILLLQLWQTLAHELSRILNNEKITIDPIVPVWFITNITESVYFDMATQISFSKMFLICCGTFYEGEINGLILSSVISTLGSCCIIIFCSGPFIKIHLNNTTSPLQTPIPLILIFRYSILFQKIQTPFMTQLRSTILASLLLITLVHSVAIVKRFQPNETFCFSDDIPQHTLIKLKTKVQAPLQLEIYSMNVLIKNKQLTGQDTESWTTQRYGVFRFCFKNYQSATGYLSYQYAMGQRANDFTSSYDGDDYIKSLQNQARIAENFISDIEKQNSEGMQIMLNESLQTSGYTCVYALSTAFVLVSVGLVAVQYKMVRKYLHNRKYL